MGTFHFSSIFLKSIHDWHKCVQKKKRLKHTFLETSNAEAVQLSEGKRAIPSLQPAHLLVFLPTKAASRMCQSLLILYVPEGWNMYPFAYSSVASDYLHLFYAK